MSVRLYLAPAAAGKTAFAVDAVRQAGQGLQSIPRVVVPTHLQVRAWRRRLAEAGGAIGVRVLTFDRLYAECLMAAGEVYTELSDPVQYRLIRRIVDDARLIHYAPLADRPGFVHILVEMIGELKAARIWPETFTQAVAALGDEPRLGELAWIYVTYQQRLQQRRWADRPGLGWLAVEALDERAPHVGSDWPLVVIDGFDNFTPVQLDFLRVLAGRVQEMVVTLTGTTDGSERPLVHRRFQRTRELLEQTLGVDSALLPEHASRQAPALAHLEAKLFRGDDGPIDAQGSVELVEAPDRAAEVRAALRWVKARLVQDGMRPGDVALLARSIAPYRPFILQTTQEFGVPMHLIEGLPLRTNPAITALLDLLRLMVPASDENPEPALPRRLVVEAWRCPYFDWSALPEEAAEPIGITPRDADALDAAARWGRIIAGLSQWEEVLSDLAAHTEEAAESAEHDEERGWPADVPVDTDAQALRDKFRRFVRRLTPRGGERSYREFVGWLEVLIGQDPELETPGFPLAEEPTSLQVVTQARAVAGSFAERDVAALRALKDVLRGLVWAEEALGVSTMDFAAFFNELVGAVEAATYRLPVRPGHEEVLVADVVQARGVPFRAVAVLGLAEGEFPATLREDPILRDGDRLRLRREFNLALEPSTESAEAEFFYETITRPAERLLLTRPRLAENGALWEASPFWEEVRRLVDVQPETLTSESVPAPGAVASWPELMESLSAHIGHDNAKAWVSEAEPSRCTALNAAAGLVSLRSAPPDEEEPSGPYDGDLTILRETLGRRFSPKHTWSPSRLENYVTCGFLFFVASVLGLEPRQEPKEGLDARQLGNIYHRILRDVYQYPGVTDPTSLEQLLAALPTIADRVLDEAPKREGFRETAWWAQTRSEIVEKVRRSLQALADLEGEFVPFKYETPFGLEGEPPLVVHEEGDSLRLRGFIDRLDVAPDRKVRIIDYKTSAPSGFQRRDVAAGRRLQLPLYALAAREALGLGEPVEGFYWHVQQAEPSGFKLSRFDGGPQGAMKVATEKAWEAVRGARAGRFVPLPPQNGCPPYCPAAAFCWRYQPGYGA
jgi:ATP-dependent helicase/DNAse subunit B